MNYEQYISGYIELEWKIKKTTMALEVPRISGILVPFKCFS